jgi:beta-N-acetylhexosaminidase
VSLPAARQIGQLLCVGFEGTSAPARLLGAIREGQVGGVILMGRNVQSAAQTATLCNELRRAAPPDLPLLVTMDQEGGSVQRLKGTRWPRAAALGAGSVERTEQIARAIGVELYAVGVGLDFAPVLDVLTGARSAVIGDRAFGSSPEHVAAHGLAYLRGLHAAGVAACGKHFPGHGGVAADSHLELPRQPASRERLEAVDLVPFARAVAAGVDALMTAHVVYQAFDHEVPGTLSRAVIGEVLRGELGYDGVVVTDDLGMKAIASGWTLEDALAGALAAGADLMLICDGAEERREQAFAAMSHLQDNDPYLQRLVAKSAARIAALKSRLPQGFTDPARATAVVGCEEHRRLAESYPPDVD